MSRLMVINNLSQLVPVQTLLDELDIKAGDFIGESDIRVVIAFFGRYSGETGMAPKGTLQFIANAAKYAWSEESDEPIYKAINHVVMVGGPLKDIDVVVRVLMSPCNPVEQ